MIKEILEKEITTLPDTIQFAKDRKYEEAWIIKRAGERPSKEQIEEYLKVDYKNLIVEYIWNSNNLEKLFVLTIFFEDGKKINPSEFINICLNLFYNYTNFSDLINKYDNQIIGKKYLLTHKPEGVKLSIFNYWLSAVPIDLWNKGETLDLENIKKKIDLRPNIKRTKLNFLGLLFIFNFSKAITGPYYGLKTPCCQKIGDEWIASYDLINYWLNILITN